MTKKIFTSTITVVSIVFFLCVSVITGIMYKYFSDVRKEQLEKELEFVKQGVEFNGQKYLDGVEYGDIRVTWIDSEGNVIFDSHNEINIMDNHNEREEIREAFETGRGYSSRYSKTLTENVIYYAVLLEDGTVIRASISIMTMAVFFLRVFIPIIVVFGVALLIVAGLIMRLAGKIVEPLNEINLDKPLENDGAYEELAPLLGKINKQRKQIKKQDAVLKRKTDEFEQILNCMNEGLVLLNERREIVSINTAAQKFFSVGDDCIGEDFLLVDRSPRMNNAVETALCGQNSEFNVRKDGGEYQINISKIEFDNKILGAVVLVFDITERAFSRRNRQEFTASISHELKTPVQSIIGSAELLQNGLVKNEDIPRFVGHIHSEAARLVTLINDIIRLSELDEGVELKKENIDLCQLAREVVGSLNQFAQNRNVEITLEAGGAVIEGVRHYVYEIIYNICDNAIRYNKENGTVKIFAGQKDGRGYIKVSDTGIGIPLEHQSRVFERFYRVDKSHSRETGGTGLGLSIVKNAVQYLGATIHMDSVVGEGTTIEIYFK